MTGKNGNKSDFSRSSSLVLVDSSLVISEIKRLFDENSPLVVSFDYKSHKKLAHNQIPHIRSEEFLSDQNIDEIQKNAYRMVYWYNEEKIRETIEYESVNLGKLFHEEAMDYLVRFLKSFFETRHIYKKYPLSTYYSSPALKPILEIFTSSIKQLDSTSSDAESYANDQIRVNFKLGKKYFMFHVSKSTYQKLKNFYDRLVHSIMRPKISNQNSKNALLVEFNTVRYEELLLAKKPPTLALSFYGRRRPAFWNLHSYSIFKKSKASLVTSYAVDQKQVELATKNRVKSAKANLQTLWKDTEFFENFFSLENISVWDATRPTFVELLENRIEKTIYEIELCKTIFAKYHFDSVVMLSEIGFTEQIVANFAKAHHVPIVLIQHGVYNDTIEANQMNVSKGVYPILSDKLLVWGQVTKNESMSNGKIPSEKIEIVGTPRYDKQKLLSTGSENQDYILLATSAPQPADIHGILSKSIEDYENSIIEISQIAAKLEKKLVIKLHPSPNEADVEELVSKIDHDITVVTSGDIFPLIRSCSVMVVLGLSTAMIEAQLLQKPVISVPVIDYKWGTPSIFESNSVITSNLESLEENLTKTLNNKSFRNDTINRANAFIDNYIINLGVGPEKTLEYLSKL